MRERKPVALYLLQEKQVSLPGGFMRKFTVLCSIVLLSALSHAQGERGVAGYCPYGCGPYIPLITTPSLTFATVSANPVGATNATGGLVAGATNSTLSEISGDTDAVYTVPVWYSGGRGPVMSPRARRTTALNHFGREREMRGMEPESYPEHERRARRMEGTREMEMAGEQPPQAWIYIGAGEQRPGATTAATGQKAKRTYTNDDVTRQEQQNGVVKYDGKTEKI
jgi:hypothetical protein